MNISELEKCSNCGACYNICPHGAIKIEENNLFYTPVVEKEKCVECGLCYNICPVNNKLTELSPIGAFAGWNCEKKIVISSSSGGIFYGLAKLALDNKGIVYGTIYSDDNKEVIFTSSDLVDISRFQKSKYVESKVLDTYKNIKSQLENNREVFFCGTPCQNAGLKQFLGKEYPNLLTCDFVCGGLPSHKLYLEYINYLEEKYKSKVKKVDFRPKTHGWKRYAVLIQFENGMQYNALGTEDPFLRSFLYGRCSVRDYCLECKFKAIHQADITIADFWKHQELSKLQNEMGISLIICNTEKGKAAIDKLKDYYLEKIDLEKALYTHKEQCLRKESKERHDKFLEHSMKYGFIDTYRKFYKDSLKTKMKNRLIRIVFRKKEFR